MEVTNRTPEDASVSFFAREERILNDLAGKSHFTFRRGAQWAIDPDTGTATYDPKFFEDKGYTPSQSTFAAFHEIKCHLVEIAELLDTKGGDRAYQRLKRRARTKQRVHIWENCRTDAKGNLAIRQLAPSLSEDTTALYREKLFPERDLTKSPKHLQFAYAVLRKIMVPDEETIVDPSVREAINGLRNVQGRDGKTSDVINLSTDPRLDPLRALRLSEKYIEPVIDKLFAEDVEEKKQQKGKGEENEGKGEGDPQESFAEDYKDYEENIHPEPLEDEDVEKKIKKTKEIRDAANRENEAYQQEHNVSIKDVADYRQDYIKVASQIEPYKDIFRRIIEERKVMVRRLRSLKEEGVMVDPGLIAQAYIDIQAGVENPRVMRDFEGVVIPENIPRSADIYFVKDQSTSMNGAKAQAQRLGTIIETEALKEGADMLDEERLADPLALQINTAVIGFGVPDRTKKYKDLSKGLTEAQRISIFKGLLELGGIGTNDYDSLVLIEKEIHQRMESDLIFAEELRVGRRKVVIIVTTDGGSNYQGFTEADARARTEKKAGDLRGLGVKVKAIALVPNGEDEHHIKDVYGTEDTVLCPSADKYTESTRQVLEKDVLDSLSFRGII